MNEDRIRSKRWPVYDHVIFDFDSTLSKIEGIDILAAGAGVGQKVSALTRQAMDGKVELESVYEKRMSAIHPTRGEIRALREKYKKNMSDDAEQVIACLLHLGHEVYIVSGGLLDPIIEIGSALGIPEDNIKAVDVEYDLFSGEWWLQQTNFDQPYLRTTPGELEKSHGKVRVVKELLSGKKGKSLLIGDGVSDLEAAEAVDLFLGYIGVTRRQVVLDSAPVVLNSSGLSPLLFIASGPGVCGKLENTEFQLLADRATKGIHSDALQFNDKALEHLFWSACQSVLQRNGSIFDYRQ